ncbi:MAG: Ureidoglycolate lyase [Deltaproteobacteria bacterium]|nr:Ureidoglycolate lyase [Deltaproteobacteria bacterium]
MKLATYLDQGQERIGAVDSAGRLVDLHRAYASYLREVESIPSAEQLAAAVLGRDMVEFLKHGEKALEAARKALAHAEKSSNSNVTIDRQQARLMAPVPRPGALVSAGKNFSDHVSEMSSKQGPSDPVAFLKSSANLVSTLVLTTRSITSPAIRHSTTSAPAT